MDKYYWRRRSVVALFFAIISLIVSGMAVGIALRERERPPIRRVPRTTPHVDTVIITEPMPRPDQRLLWREPSRS